MANQYRSITPKGIESIFQTLADADPRVGDFRLADIAQGDTQSDDVYPLVMYELVESRINEKQSGMYYTQWTIRLYCFTMVRGDWANTTDAFAETHVLLNDMILRLRKEQQFKDWGFTWKDGKVTFDYVIRKDRDKCVGTSAEISFETPLTQCLDSLPGEALPDAGLYYSASTITVPSTYLTCATLSGCTTIQSIQADIAELFTLTGSTFDCQDLLGCEYFTALSAQTQSLSAITSTHTSQIAELYTLTGGTAGVGDLESVLASGNSASNNIVLYGDVDGLDLVRTITFKNTGPSFSGNSDASVGIDVGTYFDSALYLNSPGPVRVRSRSPLGDLSSSAAYGDTALLIINGDSTGFISMGFASASTTPSIVSSYISLRGYDYSTGNLSDHAIIATGGTASSGSQYWLNLPSKSGTFALLSDFVGYSTTAHTHVSSAITDSSYGGNVAADADKLAKFNSEGQLKASVFNSTTAAVWGNSTGTGYAGFFDAGGSTACVRISQGGTGQGLYSVSFDGTGADIESTKTYALHVHAVDLLGTNVDIARFYGGLSETLRLSIKQDGGLQWNGSGSATTRTNLGLANVFVAPGANTYTAATAGNTIVGVIGSPVFTAVTATNLSGGTVFENAVSLADRYAPKDLSITLTSSTYTIQLTDDSRVVDMSGASAQNVVVPRNAAVAFPIGSQVMVVQSGAGQVTFSADTGVSLLSFSGYTKLAGQYAGASLVKKNTNVWYLFGNTSA